MRKGKELKAPRYASAVLLYNDHMTIYNIIPNNSFIKSLSPKLKTSLIGIDLLGAFNTYINIINKQYNNILYLILKPAL